MSKLESGFWKCRAWREYETGAVAALEQSRLSLLEAKAENFTARVIAGRHERARRRNHIRQSVEIEFGVDK